MKPCCMDQALAEIRMAETERDNLARLLETAKAQELAHAEEAPPGGRGRQSQPSN